MDYFYKLKKKDVSFVTTLIDSFEGVAAVRTPNPRPGEYATLHCIVAPDFEDIFRKIIRDVKKSLKLKRVKDEHI